MRLSGFIIMEMLPMKVILHLTIVITILCTLFLVMRKEMSALNSKIIHLNGTKAAATEAAHLRPSSGTHFIR